MDLLSARVLLLENLLPVHPEGAVQLCSVVGEVVRVWCWIEFRLRKVPRGLYRVLVRGRSRTIKSHRACGTNKYRGLQILSRRSEGSALQGSPEIRPWWFWIYNRKQWPWMQRKMC